MSNNVLLITGAGSGMGKMTAQLAYQQGWKVAAIDLYEISRNDLPDSNDILKFAIDITDHDAVAAAVDKCESTFGPITRVVNAAGIMPLGELSNQSRDTIVKIMRTNYEGMVNIVDTAVKRMLDRNKGEFVSYASIAGHWPTIYMGAYNAAKHAVTSFTEVLYHENIDSNVRIVCVCPPTVTTPLLKQATDTTWPKLFDALPSIEPLDVINTIDKSLKKKNCLWVFPGRFTKLSWRIRRLFPNLMWSFIHMIEKR